MKFLVGYDGSNAAKAALGLARTYSKQFRADVVVVTSIEGDIMNREEEIKKARENLLYAQSFMSEEGVETETELLARGYDPGEDIVKFVSENEIDAVFIGVRRRSLVDKMIFGSNAQFIILNVPCPVIAVK